MTILKYLGALFSGLFGALFALRGLENLVIVGNLSRGIFQAGVGVLLLLLAARAVRSARAGKTAETSEADPNTNG